MKVYVNGNELNFEESPSYYELASGLKSDGRHEILLAVSDGHLRELNKKVPDGSHVTFLDATSKAGFETYRRSAIMLFQTALSHVLKNEQVKAAVHFTAGPAFFITPDKDRECSAALVAQIEEEMWNLVSRKLPFEKRSVSTSEAVSLFHSRGMYDKEKLFRTRIASRANIYTLDDYEDYYYGFMLHDTSQLKLFSLTNYGGGILLTLPTRSDPETLPEVTFSKKMFEAQIMGETWAHQQGIGTVGDLNERIINGQLAQTILTSEALQEGRISDIASQIASREGVKFVMIAGPSSSGKTTFAQRLCIQLQAHGFRTHCISVDNYFRNREDLIPGPDGKLDFEALDSVDVEQFNMDMLLLLEGKEIRMPSFDFIQGKRVYSGETLQLGDDELLVIEGIHCLNDKLSYSLPLNCKFRIYISALTQLNIDEHNRVPSGDGRLIRRIIRDYRTRGYSASKTIAMWDSVRQGEEKNIFPYQDSADVFFNSALPYELAALKTFVVPLLFQITEDDPSFVEAKRLLKFLDYFINIPVDGVPVSSLLREFIGGGCFRM